MDKNIKNEDLISCHTTYPENYSNNFKILDYGYQSTFNDDYVKGIEMRKNNEEKEINLENIDQKKFNMEFISIKNKKDENFKIDNDIPLKDSILEMRKFMNLNRNKNKRNLEPPFKKNYKKDYNNIETKNNLSDIIVKNTKNQTEKNNLQKYLNQSYDGKDYNLIDNCSSEIDNNLKENLNLDKKMGKKNIERVKFIKVTNIDKNSKKSNIEDVYKKKNETKNKFFSDISIEKNNSYRINNREFKKFKSISPKKIDFNVKNLLYNENNDFNIIKGIHLFNKFSKSRK